MFRPRKKHYFIAIIVAVLTLGWLLYDRFIEDGNFSVFTPDVYRAATLSHHEWKEIRRENPPFHSVINLRGESLASDWYQREVTLSKQNDISFYNLGLSANHEPDMTTMETLVEMMRAAPKPLLIHCKQGADRTGLAVALYAYALLGQKAEDAGEQLSIRYGHFPWLTSRTGAMDAAFAKYVATHPHP